MDGKCSFPFWTNVVKVENRTESSQVVGEAWPLTLLTFSNGQSEMGALTGTTLNSTFSFSSNLFLSRTSHMWK